MEMEAMGKQQREEALLRAAAEGNLLRLKKMARWMGSGGKGEAAVLAAVEDGKGAARCTWRPGRGGSRSAGDTPLHLSALYGRADAARYLLDHGADPLAGKLHSPLHCAASKGDSDKLLIDLGEQEELERGSGDVTLFFDAVNRLVAIPSGFAWILGYGGLESEMLAGVKSNPVSGWRELEKEKDMHMNPRFQPDQCTSQEGGRVTLSPLAPAFAQFLDSSLIASASSTSDGVTWSNTHAFLCSRSSKAREAQSRPALCGAGEAWHRERVATSPAARRPGRAQVLVVAAKT